MRAIEERGTGGRALITRVPPWILAFLLTGCPLRPLPDGAGGGSASSSSTVTFTTGTMVGCAVEKECDDGNPCTADSCEGGICSYEPADKGTPCPDESTCNGAETCDGEGLCVAGTPVIVDDGEPCTLDLCDPVSGEVTHPESPACGAWEATPTDGAPLARTNHTAVWTGTEMIVWGGTVAAADDPALVTATGARYDPAAKKWTAMSTTNAPAPRHSHQAVWTGSKMLVWGGFGASMAELGGGIYDPATDTWAPMNLGGVPQARTNHRIVWTGTAMIVWGGLNVGALGSGASYDPASDAWTPLPTGPSPRFNHGMVWTGTKMIVWGGNDLFDWHQDGRFYDPANGWGDATSLTDVPARRESHVNLWNGSQMIVWGGFDGGTNLSSGGVFDPAVGAGGTWSTITETGAPAGRQKVAATWAGSQLMVFGGCGDESCASTKAPFGDGGFWSPGASGGTWKAVADGKIASARVNATAVWTGSQVIVWGGKAGLTGKLLGDGSESVP